jgi:hypothetical protein
MKLEDINVYKTFNIYFMMKYLKLFESFNEEDIHSICKIYGIRNYTINSDGSIDVHDDVNLFNKKLVKLPLNFNKVNGIFNCSWNELTSLEGSPKEVDGGFYCHENKLTSFEHCPEKINGNFSCSDNSLTSFEYCPKEIYGNFYCFSNKITSFDYLPFSIDGKFICYNNPIYNIWLLFKDYSKIDFFNDCDPIREPDIIILDRLNFFLEKIGKPPVSEVEGYKCK